MVRPRVLHYVGWNPHWQLRCEERQLRRVRDEQHPCCLFYRSDLCVVLGRNNRPEQWVHTRAAAADGVPVLRRTSGGGAVVLTRDVLSYSFAVPRSQLEASCRAAGLGELPATTRYIDFFRGVVIRALRAAGGSCTATGTSDISLNGRKISGNAQRISARAVLHHGTLMLRCPLAEIQRYLPLPPNRADVEHRDFLTGLREEGLACTPRQLESWLAAELDSSLAHSW